MRMGMVLVGAASSTPSKYKPFSEDDTSIWLGIHMSAVFFSHHYYNFHFAHQ